MIQQELYFPSKHPQFGKSVSFWNDTQSRHNLAYSYVQAWVNTMLATDTEDSTGVYMLPNYWTMPTAESANVRQVPLPEGLDYFGNNSVYEQYGWLPTTHLNPNGHFSCAYQLYSMLKYVMTLN